MKRTLLVLPALMLLTGCIVYSPSPTTGSYGYTYDYGTPIGEGAPLVARTVGGAGVVEPAGTAVVADRIPEPPRVPPVFSEIPDPTPGQPVVQQQTRTVVVPSSPVIREPAGAAINVQQPATAAPAAAPGAAPIVVLGGGVPFFAGTTNTNTTNVVGGPISTNRDLTGGTNIGTNVTSITNAPTNAFGILPGTNVNEGAGAQPDALNPAPGLQGFTNDPPAAPPLNEPQGAPPAALPEQPRIPSADPNAPSGSFFPLPGGTATPNAQNQQQQQQQGQQQPQAQPDAGNTTPEQQQPFAPQAPR